MKFLKDRIQFTKEKVITEAFDMSGEAGGPLGNDINWGDSLVGRLLNSVARKVKIGMDIKRIETLSKRIKSEFDDLLTDAIASSEEDESSTIEYIKISYLLGDLRTSVMEGRKVKYLITQTEGIIRYVNSVNVVRGSQGQFVISQESKDDLLKQLNDFLEFLKQFDLEAGDKGLPEDVTGLNEGEDPSKTEFEASESKEGLKYAEMISLLKNLKLILDNKDNVKTFSQGEKESSMKATNITYVMNKILSSINEFRPDDKKFGNDLLSKSKIIKWHILEVSDNKILYRKTKKLVELTEDGRLMVDIPKYDETNKRYVGESKPQLLDFNKKTIERISKYIVSKLNDIESVIKSSKDFELNEEEVKWFNQNIKGKWLVMLSSSGNLYKTQIGESNTSGKVNFLTPPVKGQIPTNVNTVISKGVLFNSKKEADDYYDEKYKSGNSVLTKKGTVTTIDQTSGKSKVDTKSEPVKEKPGEESKNENYSVFQSLEFIIEKTLLAGKKKPDGKYREDPNASEDYLNMALAKLKSQMTSMEKDGGVNSKFLGDIIEKSKETDAEGKVKNSKIIKLFLKDIKDAYNRIGDIGKLFKVSESIEAISNINQRQKSADKVARFAKFSIQLEGENMYGGLGEIGSPLKEFNRLFKKLLNTEFLEKKQESKLLTYKSFMLIKEADEENIEASPIRKGKTSEQIKEYFIKNMDYDRWTIQKTEVEKIKRNVEEASKKVNKFGYDHMIEIVKLFNRAYKIYTTPTIPSGRTGGKVSNKTFREYTNISGGSGTPDNPGIGPWRNNAIFDRFESAILDIIKSEEYKPIFNKDTVIVLGDGTEKSGGGKILLKFINDLLDGNTLYKTGAQSEFIKKYFGIDEDSKKLGLVGKKDSSDIEESVSEMADKSKDVKECKFIESKVIENISRTFYSVGLGSKEMYYLFIVSSDTDYVYIKFSKTFQNFGNYLKNDFKLLKGDIKYINTSKDEVFFGRIDINDFDIELGNSLEIKSFSISDYISSAKDVTISVDKSIQNIREIFKLVDEDKKDVKLPSSSSSSYGDNDKSIYKEFIEILKK